MSLIDRKAGNAKAPRTPMPVQPAQERVHNFDEVALGFTPDMALAEASRCLQCKKPLCRTGCPVEIRIPEFIAKIKEGDLDEAYRILCSTSGLHAVCGRVCPQETQCEGACILGKKGEPVAIGSLQRYVADTILARPHNQQPTPMLRDAKVVCIGSGPSSLTCAGYLAERGIRVTIFEELHEAGGVLMYGIPPFRLPKDVVHRELDNLRDLGVEIHTSWKGSRTVNIRALLDEGYQAVFLGVGAGLPVRLNVPGEELPGVYSANDYLSRVNLGRVWAVADQDTLPWIGRHVTVFGAGNVAMDAARTARRLGAETVKIIYRRSRAEMPARLDEIQHALEEGVELVELAAATRFIAGENGNLAAVELQRMKLGEPDESGRRSFSPVEGSLFTMQTDLTVVALGTKADPVLLDSTPNLDLNRKGYIVVDNNTGETSIPNVFAGGDIVTGAATVILAMKAGRRAAREIARRLLGPDAYDSPS